MFRPVGTPSPAHRAADTRRDWFVPLSRTRPVDSLVRSGRGTHVATLFTRFDAVCFEAPGRASDESDAAILILRSAFTD